MACEARQYGDETACGRCGLRWDTNDIDPPRCGKETGDERMRGVAGALKALAQAGARAGLVTDAANEKPKPRRFEGVATEAARELFGGPARRQLSAGTVLRNADAQAEGVPVAATLVTGGRRSGKTAAAEEWMREAVGRGEVVLQRVVGGPGLLRFGRYIMPAELPDAALEAMEQALFDANATLSRTAMRAAYRELLAYLGQA